MAYKRLLTIQDISCVGQCSLTVALPIISACGTECCIFPTGVLSTHTAGFSGYTFRNLTEDFPPVLSHWKKENIKFDYVYTGYLCGADQIEYVKQTLELLNKDGLFIVDPVMADNGVFYKGFDANFAKEMGGLCGLADVIVPNITEACFLTGMEYKSSGYDKDYIEEILDKLCALGAKSVCLTGVSFEDGKIGIATIKNGSDEIFYYFKDRINHNFHGTGDIYSSTLSGGLSIGMELEEAASLAVDYTVECMKVSYADRKEHWYGVKFEQALPYLTSRITQFNK